ncbi:UNVERIFIED_CONTAM: hypothetical protein FKN15_074651 [Acipenser sinensis]
MLRVTDESANELYELLTNYLESVGLNIHNLVAIASDGASIMIGKNRSLFSLLKKDVPNLVQIKCVCHSLHLACSYELDVLLRNTDFQVCETYEWFSHSIKRQQAYQDVYQTIKKIPAVCNTRWLSHYKVVDRVLDQWNELKLHFMISQDKELCYTASLLYKMYNDKVLYLYMLKVLFIESYT